VEKGPSPQTNRAVKEMKKGKRKNNAKGKDYYEKQFGVALNPIEGERKKTR